MPKPMPAPPWEKQKPASAAKTKLSDAAKAAARERAEKAGRRYPNLIDNMWAARWQKLHGG